MEEEEEENAKDNYDFEYSDDTEYLLGDVRLIFHQNKFTNICNISFAKQAPANSTTNSVKLLLLQYSTFL